MSHIGSLRPGTLRMGMVGGGRDAFIGAVHRLAACMDGHVAVVAGALASTPEKSLASGRDLGLDPSRVYPDWQSMLAAETKLPRERRIDFVSIVTPNFMHHPIAKAFAEAGIHVVCDKPMVLTSAQARELCEITAARRVVFGVTYNYSGYPMVKQARDLVRNGELGDIRRVVVEYHQGWLATPLETSGQKQAGWRTDPARSGAGAIGDIGSHAEQLASYITGLELDSICADLSTFLPGRRVDDDAAVMMRFAPRNGVAARGMLIASQIQAGCENDLTIRIGGSKGTLTWSQEDPNFLVLRSDGQPERIFRRGNPYLGNLAKAGARVPSGHPEGFIEAFANVYNSVAAAIRAGAGGPQAATEFDFPGVMDGARGVHFIERAIESSQSQAKWTDARFSA